MVTKGRRGVFVRTQETGETYKDQRGKEKNWWAYMPTDCPHSTYTSEDMAVAAAMYEHGRIRTHQSERAHKLRQEEKERRSKTNREE